MKERISFIYPSDLEGLEKDVNGNYVVPDGFEIYKVKSKKERLEEEKARIESELEGTSEPSDAELIEEGKMMHLYYELNNRLEEVKKELEE